MKSPLISILVAARNEESNILDLLHSIEELNYPKDKLQVLIGDDDSDDKTLSLLQEFTAQKSYYQIVRIKSEIGNLKGKTNVLAQIAHLARGQYYFYTDADIELPASWIEEMLRHFDTKKVGVVTGVTIVKGKNYFQACQAIEWLSALFLMKKLSDFKIQSTGMGNNMAVSAEAYWATGGFEKIPFSIVEDYAIYKAIIDKGYDFRQAFSAKVLAFTKPPKKYFEQRKRWVSGGFSSRSLMIIPAILQAFMLPFLVLISSLSWKVGAIAFLILFFLDSLLGLVACQQIKQKSLLKFLPLYTFYMLFFWFLQLLNYLLPTKIIWKGRAY